MYDWTNERIVQASHTHTYIHGYIYTVYVLRRIITHMYGMDCIYQSYIRMLYVSRIFSRTMNAEDSILSMSNIIL